MKYITEGDNTERPVQIETLRREDDTPMYCSEKLITHEESGDFTGSAFDSAVAGFYRMVYDRIFDGVPLAIDPADIAKVIRVIETIHAENPMNVIY